MSDEDLAEFMHLSPEEAAIIIPRLTPAKREGLEALARLYADVQLWEAGIGPKPAGVFLCGPKQIRRAGK